MKIYLRQDVQIQPKRILTARQVPLHMENEASKEVTRLVKAGILAKSRHSN